MRAQGAREEGKKDNFFPLLGRPNWARILPLEPLPRLSRRLYMYTTVRTLFILELISAILLYSQSLSSEVFSPLVVGDLRVPRGCRNDYQLSLVA